MTKYSIASPDHSNLERCFVGVDVQTARPCTFAVVNSNLKMVAGGILRREDPIRDLKEVCNRYPGSNVGIDAPRRLLDSEREFYWSGARGWRRRMRTDVGNGRHCEVVISALHLATPQWTPLRLKAPAWLKLGEELFRQLPSHCKGHEVFPSASWKQFANGTTQPVAIDLALIAPLPKDMLDAVVAAVTVYEYCAGRGSAVGGGDGLGAIILPRPVKVTDERVLNWPQS